METGEGARMKVAAVIIVIALIVFVIVCFIGKFLSATKDDSEGE